MQNVVVETKRIRWLVLLVSSIVALSCVVEASKTVPTTFVTRNHASLENKHYLLRISGGAFEDSDDEYDEMESDEEEEESLTKSAVAAVKKAKKKKTKAVTKAVSKSLSSSSSKKSMFKIPYIFRALLNPLTVLAMTKAYFGSLFNINYLDEDPSQTLRSALELKAKTASPSGGKKGARKMRPGQAKTLSDLPQLSA